MTFPGPAVTITEIDGHTEGERGIDYGEGELGCDGPRCDKAIGFYLTVDPDSDEDTPAFRLYWEITSTWPPPGESETTRWCEDCLGYLEEIAPAVVAWDGGA